jgi:hypothetical protein
VIVKLLLDSYGIHSISTTCIEIWSPHSYDTKDGLPCREKFRWNSSTQRGPKTNKKWIVRGWFLNLLASVPSRRPFSHPATVLNTSLVSSSYVPYDGTSIRDVKCIFFHGGKGPEYILKLFFKYLFVKI